MCACENGPLDFAGEEQESAVATAQPATLAAFLADSDEDFDTDLAALGITFPVEGTDMAEIDAIASATLGRMAEVQADVIRYDEARNLEMKRIDDRYEGITAPLKRRYAQLEEFALELARRADFGKKKSRKVGNGTYGFRSTPERIEVVDQEFAIKWAEANCPTALKVTTKVAQREIAPVVLLQLHETGELPQGFEHVAEGTTFFAKVER